MAGKGADAFERNATIMRAASPIQHVSKHLPRTLLVVGERDFPMLYGDARAFAKKAMGVGRDVTIFIGKGLDHMGVVRSLLDDRSPVRDQILIFLKNRGKQASGE
jgi:hypothetical protein